MIAAATRQDLQGVVEYAKNSIMNGMASRGFMQSLAGQLRTSILQNLHEMHAENQTVIRNGQADRALMAQRVASMEQELKAIHQVMNRILDQQTRAISMLQR